MKRGVWHQCGDRSQKLADEQLGAGVGVGVVISARDLAFEKASEYSAGYHSRGAHVLLDTQFYTPKSSVGKLGSYPDVNYRESISRLERLDASELADFAGKLEKICAGVGVDGVISPAVVYENGRPEINRLNRRLFEAAKAVGQRLGKPVYATAVIGRSAAATRDTMNAALSEATSLDADGWYFGFEFDEERIPSSRDAVRLCCEANLTLACTGRPVMHAYAGPMGLLSMGCGATAVGIGHSQNLWKFDRSRWEEPAGGGGGGDAPARHFSASLWGTIIDPDEIVRLGGALSAQVLTASPFRTPWNRWQANKHLVHVIGTTIGAMTTVADARQNAAAAIARLAAAVTLHDQIRAAGVELRDETGAYQDNWRAAMESLLAERTADYDYLGLLQ